MSIQRMHRLSIFFILFMQKIMTANVTFSEAFDKYLNYLRNYKNSSQATITTYSSFLNQFHLFVKYEKNLFELDVASIGIEDIHNYITYKKTKKSKSYARRNKSLSPNTLFLHIAAIRSFFKYLNMQHRSELNYTHIEQTSVVPPMVHTITDEELQALMNAPSMETKPLIRIRNRIIMLLGYYCGLRAHEILAVGFSDIPKNWWALEIRQKRNKIRKIRIKKEIADEILSYKAEKKKILGDFWGSASDYICTSFSNNSKRDKILNVSAITQIFAKYRKKLGLTTQITSHGLRRRFGTDLYANGVPAEVIQQLFGHASITTTQRYIKISDEVLEKSCLLLQ